MKVLQQCATIVALILIVASTPAWPAALSPELHSRAVNSAHVEKHELAANADHGAASPPTVAALILENTAFAVLIMLTGLGLVFCAPIPRAWLLALCGNYAAATEIYENRLARQPNRLPLYLTLANLYMLAGRRDERALIAYRVVWQMRLATQHLQASKRLDFSPRRRTTIINFFKVCFRRAKNQPVSAISRI